MNMRTRLKRGTIGAMIALMVFGAGAFADSSSVTVTAGVVNGTRTLQVTGADSGLASGPASLAFGPATTDAPFGVVVSDVVYERRGYDVSATLSDLYRVQPDGALACGETAIPSTGFSVTFDTASVADVNAALESFLTFTDDVVDDVNDVLGIEALTDPLEVTVADVPHLITDAESLATSLGVSASEVTSLVLMQPASGTDNDVFDAEATNPGCPGTGAADPDDVVLQTADNPSDPNLDSLTSAIFDGADSGSDDALTAAEAIAAGLLSPGAADTGDHTTDPIDEGGILWEATRSALDTLLTPLLSLTEGQLDDITTSVVADLLADTTGLAFDIVGQSGVYTNLPTLHLNPDAVGDATTGLYRGQMTVTLVDKPTS